MARRSSISMLPLEQRRQLDALIAAGGVTIQGVMNEAASMGVLLRKTAVHRYMKKFADRVPDGPEGVARRLAIVREIDSAAPAAEPIPRPFIAHPYSGSPPKLPAGWPTPADTEQHWRLYGEAILLSVPHIPRMLPREAGAKPRFRVAARGVPADRPGPVPGIYVLGCIQL